MEGGEFISSKTGGFRWYKNWFIWIWGQTFEFWRHIFEFGRYIFEFWQHAFEFWKLQEVGISIFDEHQWGGGMGTNQWRREVFSYKQGGFWLYKNSCILNSWQILEFWRHVIKCRQNSRWTFFSPFKSDIHVPQTILGMDSLTLGRGEALLREQKIEQVPTWDQCLQVCIYLCVVYQHLVTGCVHISSCGSRKQGHTLQCLKSSQEPIPTINLPSTKKRSAKGMVPPHGRALAKGLQPSCRVPQGHDQTRETFFFFFMFSTCGVWKSNSLLLRGSLFASTQKVCRPRSPLQFNIRNL